MKDWQLREVYFDNLRTAQIGTTDGMSPDVAADLGYTTSLDELEAVQGDQHTSHPPQPYELPGKNGRRNFARLPHPTEVQRGLAPDAIARQAETNHRGVSVARLALKQARQDR